MFKLMAGLVLVLAIMLMFTGVSASTANTVKRDWTAQELAAYLAYMQDGHEGIGDDDVVSLVRSQVPETIIKKSLDYKQRLDQSKRDLIDGLNKIIDKK